MTVVVAGASGLIGSSLVASLRSDGHEVITLVRRESRASTEVRWQPQLGGTGATAELRATLEGADAVVNLAGAGVAEKRWDDAYRQQILDSRVAATTCLATAMSEATHRPRVFVSGSASGYYGDTGPVAVDESGAAGHTFLARVCVAWEGAAHLARDAGIRVVNIRTGTVADPDGGAFGRLLPVVRLGVGGRLGSGKQWWSLISLRDEVAAIRHIIDHDTVVGPVNLAAPEQITNAELTAALGRALHRPTLAFVPRIALRAVLGDFADELLIDQRMTPKVLTDTGFTFQDQTVAAVIDGLLSGS
jgi:uncharacterized protein (TIGR01777 family)